MAILDKINLDFQLLNARDPKLLVIFDTSVWGAIESKPSIIEIILPNCTSPVIHSFTKGQANILNSSNLGVSSVGVYSDLPDGLYQITLKGSPSSYCKHRDILKTDKAELTLDSIYASLGIDNTNSKVTDKKKKLLEIDMLIKGAKASVRLGNLKKGLLYFKRAVEDMNAYIECKDCE